MVLWRYRRPCWLGAVGPSVRAPGHSKKEAHREHSDRTPLPSTTRAVATLAAGDVDAPESFAEVEIPLDPIGPHDLLVEVRAVSVNPVDLKVRASFAEQPSPKGAGLRRGRRGRRHRP